MIPLPGRIVAYLPVFVTQLAGHVERYSPVLVLSAYLSEAQTPAKSGVGHEAEKLLPGGYQGARRLLMDPGKLPSRIFYSAGPPLGHSI